MSTLHFRSFLVWGAHSVDQFVTVWIILTPLCTDNFRHRNVEALVKILRNCRREKWSLALSRWNSAELLTHLPYLPMATTHRRWDSSIKDRNCSRVNKRKLATTEKNTFAKNAKEERKKRKSPRWKEKLNPLTSPWTSQRVAAIKIVSGSRHLFSVKVVLVMLY